MQSQLNCDKNLNLFTREKKIFILDHKIKKKKEIERTVKVEEEDVRKASSRIFNFIFFTELIIEQRKL